MRRALLTAALFGALAAPAQAHITIIPAAARPGETRTLSFRVLNERQAATTKVDVYVPAGVKATPVARPGWSLAPAGDHFTWSADGPGDAISGEHAKDFQLRAGPFPHAGRVVFKALQYYDDGQIVRWIQDPKPDAERPAPVLQLTATGRAESSSGGSSSAGFAILGAVVLAGAGGGLLLLRRRRR